MVSKLLFSNTSFTTNNNNTQSDNLSFSNTSLSTNNNNTQSDNLSINLFASIIGRENSSLNHNMDSKESIDTVFTSKSDGKDDDDLM